MQEVESKIPGSLGAKATLACLWEATAPKPGNVYRGADFSDTSYADFLLSAVAIGPVFDAAIDTPLGRLIHSAVSATQRAVATNTNLGTVLLLAPLARASPDAELRKAVPRELAESTIEDAALAYQAIRLARPGGLGEAPEADVASAPSITLLEAMRLAEERDLVAWQYSHEFEDVFAVADAIAGHIEAGKSLADAITWAHLEQMSRKPDTLIARKCGEAVARESAARAGRVLQLIGDGEDFGAAAAELDFWLRADGNRRNPGATADLIAAALFVLLVEDRLSWPVRFYSHAVS